jgi:hypothetical protein
VRKNERITRVKKKQHQEDLWRAEILMPAGREGQEGDSMRLAESDREKERGRVRRSKLHLGMGCRC